MRPRLQHHVSLGDGVDQRAGLDLVRAPRLVVSVETGEAVEQSVSSVHLGDENKAGRDLRERDPCPRLNKLSFPATA